MILFSTTGPDPQKPQRTNLRLCLFGLLAIVALGLWQVFTADTLVRQLWNMRLAEAHLPLVRQKLNSFPESFNVRVMAYTGAGGSLMVEAYVPTPEDERRVKVAVEQTVPPVKVVYHVRVVGTNGVLEAK